MKCLSVRQPWAGAILTLAKDVENRTWRFNHRGLLLIHSSQRLDDGNPVAEVERISGRTVPLLGTPRAGTAWELGAITGVVVVTGCHHASDCDDRGALCSRWAQPGQFHIRMSDPRVLDNPVYCNGSLGLWTPDEFTATKVSEQLR